MNDQLQLALEVAIQKHKNQTDKSGKPYILHPLHVMNNVDSLEAKIVAILHDTIEDTDLTIDDLHKLGFEKNIIDAISLLTRSEDEDYFEYVKKIRQNELATKVKLEDLKHNMDLNRIPNITKKDLERKEKYQKAYNYLTES